MPLQLPGTTRSDRAVAAGCWLIAAASLVAVVALADIDPESAGRAPDTGTAGWWLGLAVVSAQAFALLWRRTAPAPVLWLVALGGPVAALAGVGDAISATSFAVLVAAYTLTTSRPARESTTALVGATALVGLGMVLAGPGGEPLSALTVAAGLLQGVATVGMAVGVGVVVRTRREVADARTAQIEALSREQGARVEAALARERAAMARELHDIAAHHLSGIAVMTGAIVGQIDADPDAAKASVRRVRSETTAMLDELRSLVRLLRDARPAEEGADDGVQTLATVPALVERARASGVDATLTVLGTADGTPPADAAGPLAQLAAYRTVQECLANVVRHAPGARCEVVLDARDPATLLITVGNGPSPTPDAQRAAAGGRGGGLGLIGMQERADLTDAHLTYGPRPDGGWLVTLAVPTHHTAAPAGADGTVHAQDEGDR